MSDQRWTLDPDIDAYLKQMVLPKELLERLARERDPIETAAPKVGNTAPDFSVERLSDNGERAGENLRLSDYRGQQLALMFGSYTCPVFRGQIQRFNDIYKELRDRYQFLVIYTREAHPEDGWQVDINHAQNVVYDQPTDADGRADIVQSCKQQHDIALPMALDDMEDRVEKLYSGAPERLYIINAAGVVTHRSGRGPFGMAMIDSWHQALKELAGEAAA